jgi:hypothetical protein
VKVPGEKHARRGCRATRGEAMFKLLLISIVVAPVLLGMQAAKSRRGWHGFVLLLALLFTFNALYLIMLYCLRFRWVY